MSKQARENCREAPASEFVREFAKWADTAQREPVAVTRHGRPFLTVMAYEAWEELNRQDEQRTRELRFLRALIHPRYFDFSLEEQQEAWQAAADFAAKPAPQFLGFINDPDADEIRAWPSRTPRPPAPKDP